jgi:hypothetical protein
MADNVLILIHYEELSGVSEKPDGRLGPITYNGI